MHLIKRYKNRKLYDTEEKRYVTLHGIATLLRDGAEVKVVDNATKKEITSKVLAQVLADAERQNGGSVSGGALVDLLRRGRTAVQGAVKKSSTALSQAATLFEEGYAGKVEKLRQAGEISEREARKILDVLKKTARDNRKMVSAHLDVAVKAALSRLDVPSRADIDALSRKVSKLESHLKKKTGTSRRKKAAPKRTPAKRKSPVTAGRQKRSVGVSKAAARTRRSKATSRKGV